MKETRSFEEVIKHRRSYYALKSESPVSDVELENLVKFAVKYVPSAFNSQTTRLILLLGDHHKAFWTIVKETLRKLVSTEQFVNTEKKIEKGFMGGYGTILFFEDESIIRKLQLDMPTYSDNFPVWMQHTSAMHQFALWSMLEDLGFGASLQHYNPLIDEEVREKWNLPEDWRLIAQMPFGIPVKEPGEKDFSSVEKRVKVFK